MSDDGKYVFASTGASSTTTGAFSSNYGASFSSKTTTSSGFRSYCKFSHNGYYLVVAPASSGKWVLYTSYGASSSELTSPLTVGNALTDMSYDGKYIYVANNSQIARYNVTASTWFTSTYNFKYVSGANVITAVKTFNNGKSVYVFMYNSSSSPANRYILRSDDYGASFRRLSFLISGNNPGTQISDVTNDGKYLFIPIYKGSTGAPNAAAMLITNENTIKYFNISNLDVVSHLSISSDGRFMCAAKSNASLSSGYISNNYGASWLSKVTSAYTGGCGISKEDNGISSNINYSFSKVSNTAGYIKITNPSLYNLYNWSPKISGLTLTGNLKITDFSNFSIVAQDNFSTTAINSFSIRISNNSFSYTCMTTGGMCITPAKPNKKYNITVYGNSYYVNYTLTNYNIGTTSIYTANLISKNSIYARVFDSNGNLKTIGTYPIRLVGLSNSYLYNITSGSKYIFNISYGTYTAYLNASTFIQTYYVTVNGTGTIFLNMYLPSAPELKIFSVRNIQNGAITGSVVTAELLIDSVKVPVGQGTTDASGATSIYLDNWKSYDIVIDAPGYPTKTSTINTIPNSFGLYTYYFTLTSNNTFNFNTYLDYYSYSYSPIITNLNSTGNQKFNLTVSSPGGYIQYITVYYNSTKFTNLSGTPAGGSVILTLNLSNFNYAQVIPIKYTIATYSSVNRTLTWTTYYIRTLNNSIINTQQNAGKSLDDFGKNNNYSVSTRVMLASFIIALLVLFLSGFFPSDYNDGAKKGNNAIVVAGLALMTSFSLMPLSLTLVFGFMFVLELLWGED